jgi:hypothetical protein
MTGHVLAIDGGRLALWASRLRGLIRLSARGPVEPALLELQAAGMPSVATKTTITTTAASVTGSCGETP